MNIIVGLGNPGAKYKYSRHNIGFQVVDKFALQIFGNNLKWKKKFQAHILQGKFQGQDLILIKPQTFMNLSGSSVRDIMAYFHIAPEQLLVIYDDFHLPLGKIRIRKRGSSGGHNGIESIINTLRTEVFPRLRIGIRNTQFLPDLDYADFVLANFLPDELKLMEQTAGKAVQAIEDIISYGYEFAMQEYNGLDLTE